MVNMFWDAKGVEFMECGLIVTSNVYCELLNKLRRAIQNKCCDLLMAGFLFLHNNACHHTVRQTKICYFNLNGTFFYHAPYCHDFHRNEPISILTQSN